MSHEKCNGCHKKDNPDDATKKPADDKGKKKCQGGCNNGKGTDAEKQGKIGGG